MDEELRKELLDRLDRAMNEIMTVADILSNHDQAMVGRLQAAHGIVNNVHQDVRTKEPTMANDDIITFKGKPIPRDLIAPKETR